MKQPIFIQNTPIDEKRISFIEKIVSKLARRAKTTAKAIVTPYPISNCVIGDNVKGDVLRYMFIGSGIITKGRIQLRSKPKDGASVVLTIENKLGGNSKSYNLARDNLLIEPNIPVQSGDRLVVSIFPINPEDMIPECWVAFQWVPDVKDSVIKKYLFDEIEKDVLEEEN